MQFKQMSKQQLIDYAASKGFALDEKLDKPRMIELIKEGEEKVKQEEGNRTENTIKKWCKTQKDELMTVRFQNLDSPGSDLEFTLSLGVKEASHICPKCKVKFLIGRDDPVPYCDKCDILAIEKPILKNSDYHFHFYDREVYDMPKKIITYLNSLQTRHDKAAVDPVTGLVRTIKGFKNKFACIPINLTSAISA